MAGVKLEGVAKHFKGAVAVAEFNLDIKDGEFLVLVGPSGCGKSTTLRMVAGLEEPTYGRIMIGNKDVTKLEPKDRDIAMVFQDYALYPHMNVYHNLAFGLKLRKMPKNEIEERVKMAAEILSISHLLERYPRQLSGGQRQRVALGRAIVRNPQVFLMDEPLSNLDAKLRVQMRAELVKLQRRLKTTTIYVTHDQTEAMTMGDRIVVMKDGYIQQVGTPEEIYHEPANLFVADFVGSPSMNFLEGELCTEEGCTWFKAQGIRVNLRNNLNLAELNENKVVLGIRPEDVYLHRPFQDKVYEELLCQTELIEDLGSEKIVFLKIEGQELQARLRDGAAPVTVGGNTPAYLNLNKVHLFRKSTGKKILFRGR